MSGVKKGWGGGGGGGGKKTFLLKKNIYNLVCYFVLDLRVLF